MKTLYLECYSGISGDMTVAALLDLGADRKGMEKTLNELDVPGYELKFGRAEKNGIDAYDFDVILEGHEHEHHHDHDHEHEHHHDHVHVHEHEHHHDHIHRNIHDVEEIIDRIDGQEDVKKLAKKIFMIVAEAESKAHGLPLDEVHFHEVGAVDSIVDIVGAAYCITDLGIEKVITSDIYEGSGHVHCQHGTLPVPVPAVLNTAQAYSLPLRITDNEGEMVTPTGAAIAAALRSDEKLPEKYEIKRVGIGAGKKDFKKANILRAMIIEPASGKSDEDEDIWELETDIDDCSGEAVGYAIEKLMAAGARDAFCVPIFMKKNRPAQMIKVLCDSELIERMEDILFKDTTTIGIRKWPVTRTILGRREETVDTPYGKANVKVCEHDGNTYYRPEADSVKAICEVSGKGWQEIYNEIVRSATK